MPKDSSPTIQGFRVRTVRVPMPQPHRTASGVITESPLVLMDVVTDSGAIGHSIVFTYTPAALKPTAELIQNLEPLVKGEVLARPPTSNRSSAKRFRLLGTQGLVGMALAAIDMALWDALARVHGVIGGVTAWPELSARLLCCTPTAHWLEYADWWNPALAEPLRIEGGMAVVGDSIGSGIDWNEDAVCRLAA